MAGAAAWQSRSAHGRRAYTLLWSADGTADREIAARVGCSVQTVAKTRRRWVQEGWGALVDQARSGRPRCLEGRQEAQLVALACSQPPAERGAWTMQLLADEMVTLGWVATLSRSTVQRVLKKTG